MTVSKLALCIMAAGAATQAWSAGFEVPQRGIKEMGIAYSGNAALLEDASAVGNNPAGLTRLEGTQIAIGATVLLPTFEYDVDARRELIEQVGGTVPTTEPRQDSVKGQAEAPHLYFSHRLSDNSAFGLGIYGMFGSATEYDDDWVGRYHATNTEITGININPAFAFDISDSWSVGMGVMVQYLTGQFDSKIDVGYIAADEVIKQIQDNPLVGIGGSGCGLFQSSAACIVDGEGENNYDGLAHNFDVDNFIEVDSWGYGFSFGLLYEPSENTRIGFDYRSAISHSAEGTANRPQTLDADFEQRLADAIFEALPDIAVLGGGRAQANEGAAKAVGPLGAAGGDVRLNLTMPEIATVSFYQRLFGSGLAATGGVTWSNWSRIDEFRFEYIDESERGASPIVPDSDEDVRRRDLVVPFDWEDTWRYGIGFIYDGFETLTFRIGISYDESPVPSAERRTPRGPDSDRTIYAAGLSWAPSDRLGIDLGYTFTDLEEAEIRNPENPAGTQHRLTGTYNTHIHSLGAQLNYRF